MSDHRRFSSARVQATHLPTRPSSRSHVALGPTTALVIGICSVLVGCVHTEVAVVSQHTALERQAAGEYPEQETSLESELIRPGPMPIPREQLAGTGADGDLGVVAELVAHGESDAERVDALSRARCVGEALSGLLEQRTAECTLDVDGTEVARLVGRVNLHRRQVWEFLASRAEGSNVDGARAAWRTAHLARVVCGALIEARAGVWEPKGCA